MKNINDQIRYQIWKQANHQVFDQVNFLIYDLIQNQVWFQSDLQIHLQAIIQIEKVKSWKTLYVDLTIKSFYHFSGKLMN
jgi:hypothetical protein